MALKNKFTKFLRRSYNGYLQVFSDVDISEEYERNIFYYFNLSLVIFILIIGLSYYGLIQKGIIRVDMVAYYIYTYIILLSSSVTYTITILVFSAEKPYDNKNYTKVLLMAIFGFCLGLACIIIYFKIGMNLEKDIDYYLANLIGHQ